MLSPSCRTRRLPSRGMTTGTDRASNGADWPCSAYGPEGLAAGARCFRSAEPGEWVCSSRAVCEDFMAAERQRVFRRINELAATGDPDFADLDAAFPLAGRPAQRRRRARG